MKMQLQQCAFMPKRTELLQNLLAHSEGDAGGEFTASVR
jgi:hypothetical protein